MVSPYANRFWKKNWDNFVSDLEYEEYNTTMVDLMMSTFRDFPDVMALEYYGLEMTFAELDKYSNQFATMLIENGFKKGDVVGINLPNTPQYIIAAVGTLKSGCIVSGVSPLLSTVQIHYQLNDLGTDGKQVALVTLDSSFSDHIVKIADKIKQLRLVVTTNVGSFLPKITDDLIKTYGEIAEVEVTQLEGRKVLDFQDDILKKYSTNSVNIDISPDDVGWIQYTGGTTGPPKGAMLTHRGRVSNVIGLERWLQWEKGKEITCSGFPFFHVAGVNTFEISIYTATGQLLILNPRDTDYIVKLMIKYHPTNLSNVPSLYQLLMKNPKFKELDHSQLRFCFCAASPFPKESQEELESIIGKNKLIEVYGMTELSPVATVNPYLGVKKLGTVGLPIQNVDLKIVDPETGDEVPLGAPGEILVAGPLVMPGYHNKPDETKNAIDKAGYMHTGDVGIMDEDGYIRIVDRTKDMIIVGGFKVFSAKMEDVLSKHPAIGSVALIGIPNPKRPGSEIVKAYIQLHPEYDYNGNVAGLEEDIIKFAKNNCAPYEVPKVIEIVDELPLTPVGKIDKKILRKG
ncbi:MAG: AMP-binding protein [Promethearchaeota archaeon]|jgi:long-chain acyl-CoA synthetase